MLVARGHYVHPNVAKKKKKRSSESERVLFLLVSFHQEVEKVIHFHLPFFFPSSAQPPPPPSFTSFSPSTNYSRISYQSQMTDSYTTKPKPSVGGLRIAMSLSGSVLLGRVSHQSGRNKSLWNWHPLPQARMHMSGTDDSWVSGMLQQHFSWNPKSLKVGVFWNWHTRIDLAMLLPWLHI